MQSTSLKNNDREKISISDFIKLMNKKYQLFNINNKEERAKKIDTYSKYIRKLVDQYQITYHSEGKRTYMFDWEQVQELQELTQPYFKKEKMKN